MSKKTKFKRVSLYLTKPLEDMIMDLMKKRGDTSMAETIKESIRQYHTKLLPLYVTGIPKEPKPSVDRESIIKQQMVDKDIKRKIKGNMLQEEQLRICTILGGTTDGVSCTYYKYAERNRYEQTVPLHMLSEDMIETQYVPSKERVEEIKKKGLANY